MLVNVCPSGFADAPSEHVWSILATTERYGEWVDAEVLSITPPGPAQPGQHLELGPRFLGRRLRATIDVEDVDPQRRWLQLLARVPFGIENHERITLTPWEEHRTLVRFN